MNTVQDCFLQEILDNPANDAVRLIYADWLQENGQDERADFIRVQIEYAALQSDECACGFVGLAANGRWPPCDVCRLASRGQELLDVTAHWSGWTRQGFDALAYDVGVSTDGERQHVCLYDNQKNILAEFWCRFHRGFLGDIDCSLQAWHDHGRMLVRTHPIEQVVLSDKRPKGSRTAIQKNAPWGWFKGGFDATWDYADQEDLQEDVWDVLQGGREYGWWKYYQTEALALAAVSRACIVWAKGLAE